VHSSSGYKQSLEEVLTKPDVKVLIKNTKYNDDNVVMERFNEVLGKEMDKAFFGLAAFEIASKKNAIDTLIITDNFLRTISPTTRKHVSNVIKTLKGKGVRVHKMSSQHVAGEKVDAFGGIVGVLTYVVEEIAEIGAEGIENEEEGNKEEEEGVQDEMLMEMINNNYSYNDEEEDTGKKEEGKKKKKEGEKEKGKKKKGGAKKKGNNVEEEDDGEDDDY
jgi:protein pelota